MDTLYGSLYLFLRLFTQQSNLRMKILTTKQAAKALDVNDSRVRQLILSGRLPALKLGRDWIIKENDLKKVENRKPGRPRKERK